MDKEINKKIADLLFPIIANGTEKNRAYFEAFYKLRDISNGQEYLRLAPSPTGELHSGALYLAMLCDLVAHKNNGKLILRIEDTDKLREINGAKERMVKYFEYYNIKIDEGYELDNIKNENKLDRGSDLELEKNLSIKIKEIGDYGPYTQSERIDIYNAFLYDFILKGHAYPCFITSEELTALREEQTVMKVRPGIYGKYAKSRDLTFDEVKNKIEAGEKYVIRLKSSGDFTKKIKFTDEVMGDLELSQNDEDFVIAKGDGVPTYHFAHLIDDYLMRVTFVMRANEWVASITKHIELWEKLGVASIKYGHIMPINKRDGKAVRKLSKRKDPEASVSYYIAEGYTVDALKAYLLRLASPSFDDWWDAQVKVSDQNRNKINIAEFPFNFEEIKRNSRGPLLDFDKLNNMSADIVAGMSARDASLEILNWAKEYDAGLFEIIKIDDIYLEKVLNIERETEQKRKDIAKWSNVRDQIFYFYEELFESEEVQNENKFTSTEKEILKIFASKIQEIGFKNCMQSLEVWMEKMKIIYNENFAVNEEFKVEIKKGELLESRNIKFGEVMMLLRKAITKREKTPNLYLIFEVLGEERVLGRLNSN